MAAVDSTQTTQTALPQAGTWSLDTTHTDVSFTARHLMVTKVRGRFPLQAGEVTITENPLESSVVATLDVAGVHSGEQGRDDHLRNADFFEVEKYPTITFVSTSAEQKGDDDFVLSGDLTIKGVTKPVSIEFERTGAAVDPWGNFRVGFEGKTKIDRTDWGVDFNAPLGAGGLVISEKVNLEFDIAAVRRAS